MSLIIQIRKVFVKNLSYAIAYRNLNNIVKCTYIGKVTLQLRYK